MKTDGTAIIKGAATGLAAGLAATWIMTKYQEYTQDKFFGESSGDDSGESSTVKAAEAVSETVRGHGLEEGEKQPAGNLVHYAMGGFSGMVYGVATEIEPRTAMGAGLPFGTAVWMLADNLAVPALELSEPPTEQSAATHAYALSSHLVYGLATDVCRRAIGRVL